MLQILKPILTVAGALYAGWEVDSPCLTMPHELKLQLQHRQNPDDTPETLSPEPSTLNPKP